MKLKRGDTLIEVALAIGIFSMVAITVVSVTTASTTAAQASLEVTLTREEIDAQAEALRFIHNAYLAGSQSADTSQNLYKKLWDGITDRATNQTNNSGRISLNINDVGANCEGLYDGKGSTVDNKAGANAFIINTRRLNNPSKLDNIIIKNGTDKKFFKATTYPRILYGTSEDPTLYSSERGGNTINRAEGIFIIGYKAGDKSTSIIQTGDKVKKQSAYYDFYIRACWMPPGATRASTISTVVRLSDPAIVAH